jgi:hypothetical protein
MLSVAAPVGALLVPPAVPGVLFTSHEAVPLVYHNWLKFWKFSSALMLPLTVTVTPPGDDVDVGVGVGVGFGVELDVGVGVVGGGVGPPPPPGGLTLPPPPPPQAASTASAPTATKDPESCNSFIILNPHAGKVA